MADETAPVVKEAQSAWKSVLWGLALGAAGYLAEPIAHALPDVADSLSALLPELVRPYGQQALQWGAGALSAYILAWKVRKGIKSTAKAGVETDAADLSKSDVKKLYGK